MKKSRPQKRNIVNESGIVNLVGLWSAPGHRDVGVAPALLAAVEATVGTRTVG